ncbi:hypothetical protein [Janibacter limosus]|jgi:hypothetical protein|nr:hypothetical protein [Janibacter limosus]
MRFALLVRLRSASGAVIVGAVGAALFGGGGLYLLTRPDRRRSRR